MRIVNGSVGSWNRVVIVLKIKCWGIYSLTLYLSNSWENQSCENME